MTGRDILGDQLIQSGFMDGDLSLQKHIQFCLVGFDHVNFVAKFCEASSGDETNVTTNNNRNFHFHFHLLLHIARVSVKGRGIDLSLRHQVPEITSSNASLEQSRCRTEPSTTRRAWPGWHA